MNLCMLPTLIIITSLNVGIYPVRPFVVMPLTLKQWIVLHFMFVFLAVCYYTNIRLTNQQRQENSKVIHT